MLAPRLRDGRITAVLEKILESGASLYRRPRMRVFYGDPEPGRPRGLPIGNLTSQWWGNLYLNGADHFAKRELRISGYLRYMDDMVCFADDRGALRAHRNALGDWLWEERRLRLNVRKGHIRSTEQPHTYLGYRVTRRGFDLGPRASRRFRTWLADAVAAGDEEKLDRGLASWRGAMGF